MNVASINKTVIKLLCKSQKPLLSNVKFTNITLLDVVNHQKNLFISQSNENERF